MNTDFSYDLYLEGIPPQTLSFDYKTYTTVMIHQNKLTVLLENPPGFKILPIFYLIVLLISFSLLISFMTKT